jgi:predicted hydrocarbon binding protein
LAIRQMFEGMLREREVFSKDEGFEFRFETFQDLKTSLLSIFGAAGRVIVYDAGIEPGRRSYRRTMSVARSRDEALQLLVQKKRLQNWGDLVLEELDFETKSGRVSVSNCFEAREASSKGPSCDFFRGYLSGFLSELFGEEKVVMREESCMADGGSRCTFVFGIV